MSADMSAITQAAAVTAGSTGKLLRRTLILLNFWPAFPFLIFLEFFFRGFLREILETLTTKRMRQRLMGDCGCQGRNKGGTKGERDCCSFIFELLDRS